MGRTFMRGAMDALAPKGAAWKPAAQGSLDRFLNGIAASRQTTLDRLEGLAHIRDPYRCPAELLPDLEQEFGLIQDEFLADAERRQRVAAVRYKHNAIPTPDKLQWTLDKGGFGKGGLGLVVVCNESPAIAPGLYVNNKTRNYYLLNEDNHAIKLARSQAGQICARAADGSDWKSGHECAGFYTERDELYNRYPTPPKEYWPYVFFVCGGVESDKAGKIASLSCAEAPLKRRQELNRIVLRAKPEGSWAAMLINYAFQEEGR